MSGFPIRPALSAFGPTIENIAPVRNPTTDLDAAKWNLLKYQAAGLGLMTPRVLFKLTIDNPMALLARSEAWNPSGASTGDYADPSLAYVSTGRGTVEWTTPIPDQNGDDQVVAFSWALGWFGGDPPTTLKWVQAEPVAATPAIITVCVFDAAGSLEDGNDVWVAAG